MPFSEATLHKTLSAVLSFRYKYKLVFLYILFMHVYCAPPVALSLYKTSEIYKNKHSACL